ncbi:MAG: hypothetical protein IPM26_02820 [Saprospiraceae bacterium]|nr:hypothetical protein [Saprospiraceae bacterium]
MVLKKLTYLFVAVLSLLLIPFAAMKFTDEVQWTGSDFLVAGLMLFSAGVVHLFGILRIKIAKYRWFASLILIVVFLLIWAELAVGLFG